MWFKFERLNDYLTRIHMPYVCAYFIEGDERGLLIDTGWGLGDLKGQLEAYTNKPYQVVLSHGHCDHGGGAGQFDQVFLSKEDHDLEKYSCSFEVRDMIYHMVASPEDQNFDPGLWQTQRKAPFHALTKGQVFDLGNLEVMADRWPGHTSGSMIFWIEKYQILITGDACSNPVLMNQNSSTDILTFYEAGLRVVHRYPDIKRILTNHAPFEEEIVIVSQTLEIARKIINHQDDRFLLNLKTDRPSYAAINKKDHPYLKANIIYSLDKLV